MPKKANSKVSDNTRGSSRERLELTSNHKGYRRNGKNIPSVSLVLDRIYPKTFQFPQEYVDRGTAVHVICETILKDYLVYDIPLDLTDYIVAFRDWLISIRWNAIRKEKVLTEDKFTSKYNYGGKRDIIMPDRGWLVDIKTGVEQKKRDHMQLVAYADGDSKLKLYNLYLSKDGTFRFIKRPYCRVMYKVFLCQVTVLNYTGGINE
jgi:hypothetical protein